jgi:hypothetical protein
MPYGVYVLRCTCGWRTINKKPNVVCEKCGNYVNNPKNKDLEGGVLPEEFFDEQVACQIATIAEQRSREIQRLAEQHGYCVLQTSPKRYMVLRYDRPCTFGLVNSPGHWCFMQMEMVKENLTYQQATSYIKEKTKAIPEYLCNK